MKMKEYRESERSEIFKVELVVKNMVHVSPGTHFMHMRIKQYQWVRDFFRG